MSRNKRIANEIFYSKLRIARLASSDSVIPKTPQPVDEVRAINIIVTFVKCLKTFY